MSGKGSGHAQILDIAEIFGKIRAGLAARHTAEMAAAAGARSLRGAGGGVRADGQGCRRPEAVRRVKTYSAATGYVYQYYFYEVRKAHRGFSAGTEYVYMVSLDRRHVFPLRIFVKQSAVEKWGRTAGRALSGTEEYAIAKLRLFQALDDSQEAEGKQLDISVDESNLEALLSQLDI